MNAYENYRLFTISLIIPRILCKFAIPKYIIEYGTSIEYLQHAYEKALSNKAIQLFDKYSFICHGDFISFYFMDYEITYCIKAVCCIVLLYS